MLLTVCISVQASKPVRARIFLTSESYRQGQAAYACTTEQLVLQPFWACNSVGVHTASGHLRIPVRTLFAISFDNGRLIRFYRNAALELKDTSGLCIYASRYEEQVAVSRRFTTRYELRKGYRYYFSLRKDSEIYPLTLNRLKPIYGLESERANQLSHTFNVDSALWQVGKQHPYSINDFIQLHQ